MIFSRKPDIVALRRKGKIDKLIKLLRNHNDYGVKRDVISALGILGDKRAVKPLCEVFRGVGKRIRIDAAEALGDIGDPGALNHLIKCLDSEVADLQIVAADAIGKIGSAEALPSLKAHRHSSEPNFKASVISAMGMIGNSESVAILTDDFWEQSEESQIEIVNALRYSKDKSSSVFMKEAYKSASPPVRGAIAKVLSKRGWTPEKEKADAWTRMEFKDEITVLPPKIAELIKQKSDLPAIPEVIAKINALISDPKCSAGQVSDLIKTDPTMATRVVQVANSAYYSSGVVEITDLTTAVTRLGLLQLRNIVTAFSLLTQFSALKMIDMRKFWIHSFTAAQLSKQIMKALRKPEAQQETAYYAGLMHDIGIAVFMHIMPDIYQRLVKGFIDNIASENRKPLQNVEFHVYKTDHAVIGAQYIHHWWPVDDEIVAAVHNHHKPLNNPKLTELDKVIIIANHYCRTLGFDNGLEFSMELPVFNTEEFRSLSMTDAQIEEFLSKIDEEIEVAEMILSFL